MDLHDHDPASVEIRRGGLSLKGRPFIELLHAVHDKGAALRFRAAGSSMSPFIRDGDVITVSPLPSRSLRFGDVVAFVYQGTGRIRVHRVIGKRTGSYLLKGDSAPTKDGLVPKDDILGIVTRIERDGRRVNFGLGPERLVVACLTISGLIHYLGRPLLETLHRAVRKMAK